MAAAITAQWVLSSLVIMLQNCGQYAIQLLPYILAGVLISEILKYTSWTKLLYKWTSKNPFIATIAAVLLGMVSPLCTYGTVPVVIDLYRAGIGIAPLIAFLSASSLMNPQLFIITLGGIDLNMALMRLVFVFILAVILAVILYRIPSKYVVRAGVYIDPEKAEAIEQRKPKKFHIKQYLLDCLDSLKFMGFYIAIGILVGAIIDTYVPTSFLYYLFRPGQFTSVLFAALAGVPMYACGGGVIPMVRSMLVNGMSRGAAMAFFITGPATRPTPIMAMATLLRPRFIVAYLVFVMAFSLLIGVVYR